MRDVELNFGPLYFFVDFEVLRGGERGAVGLLKCASMLDHDALGVVVLEGVLVLDGLLQRLVVAVYFDFLLAGLRVGLFQLQILPVETAGAATLPHL